MSHARSPHDPIPPSAAGTVELATFAAFAELAPDAIVAVDERGLIRVANSHVEQVFGHPSEQLVGRSVDALVPIGVRGVHARHRERYRAEPRVRIMGEGRLDLRGLRHDGSEFPAEIALSVIDTPQGRLTVAAIRDVTARVQAEHERSELQARLAREQAAARSSRMESIGQLAGGVAHDFNNLLSVVLGNAEFLAAHMTPGTQEHEEVEEIRRAASKAATLTRQLLTFSRHEVIAPQPIDLNSVVRDVARLLRRTIGEHVELSCELAPELPQVLGDAGGIEQILVNLAINARDAMPGGGSLVIATEVLDLSATEGEARPTLSGGRFARLLVSDTGHGMTEETAGRAFEPFYSTKPKAEGTGLGLATVYGIVRQLGGDIEIRSALGEGTTMIVDLPLSAESPHPHRGGTAPGGPVCGDGQQILLVEDDDAVRRTATRILVRAGYEVTSVAGGAAALQALAAQAGAFDLLLTDVIMPEMLGPELAVCARRIAPGLPVIFMSGYIDPQADIDQVPHEAVVRKPFDEASLAGAVRLALRSTAAGEPAYEP